LEVELVTGRTHQIRAHLAHIGCPILGDSKYGNNAANRELRFKYQALCAWELRFPAQISDPRFAHLAGRVFHAEKPWYYQQILDGTLK
jgi:23S rRNA pseudouridine955/2504/2580 synthase